LNKFTACALFIFIIFYSINAIDDNTKKTLNYTCILNNVENLAKAKDNLELKVKDFLAGYVLGINFSIEKEMVKLLTNGELSFFDREFDIKEKKINNVSYIIEVGKYRYFSPQITDYSKKYTLRVSRKGDDFWKIYRSLLIYCLKSSLNKKSKGIIVPQGDLDVILTKNNTIIVTETFTVYIK
jgi:hypothetical protein